MRNEIRGLMIDKGLPSFFITINPADVYNPVVKLLAGAEIDVDKLLPEEVPNYWEQAILVTKNPAVAAHFFNIYINAFIKCILGYNNKRHQFSNGILGQVKAYYGCVEAQGRGSLHCHMLIWLEGALNPDEIKKKLMDEHETDFQERLVAYLDDTISTLIPDPEPETEDDIIQAHPCSI